MPWPKSLYDDSMETEDGIFELVKIPSQARNVFCPTGKGGGIDPTCSPGKSNIAPSDRHLPGILKGLAAEARKAGSYEEFRRGFLQEGRQGLYWHWTDSKDFSISSAKGPRDASTLGVGGMSVGKLMVSSDIGAWSRYGGSRPYAVLVDLRNTSRKAQVNVARGFGQEFSVQDLSSAKVVKVYSRRAAFDYDRKQRKRLPGSEEKLRDFYDKVTGATTNVFCPSGAGP